MSLQEQKQQQRQRIGSHQLAEWMEFRLEVVAMNTALQGLVFFLALFKVNRIKLFHLLRRLASTVCTYTSGEEVSHNNNSNNLWERCRVDR